MKKTILTFVMFLSVFTMFAQVPQAMNYQAIARDNAGNVIPNSTIAVEFIIHDSIPTGNAVFIEDSTKTTNIFGLFTHEIGKGVPVTGSISAIQWGHGNKFMEVKVNGISMGTTQLISVPYALAAGSVGTNVSFCARNAGSITFPAYIWTTVPFTIVDYNNGNSFSTSTNNFIAPISGIYHFDAAVTCGNTNTFFVLDMYVNSIMTREAASGGIGNGAPASTNISCDLFLNVGDSVHLEFNPYGVLVSSENYFNGRLTH